MIDAAIARARTYLEHAVPLDGELPVLVSARAELTPATRDSTTFTRDGDARPRILA